MPLNAARSNQRPPRFDAHLPHRARRPARAPWTQMLAATQRVRLLEFLQCSPRPSRPRTGRGRPDGRARRRCRCRPHRCYQDRAPKNGHGNRA